MAVTRNHVHRLVINWFLVEKDSSKLTHTYVCTYVNSKRWLKLALQIELVRSSTHYAQSAKGLIPALHPGFQTMVRWVGS